MRAYCSLKNHIPLKETIADKNNHQAGEDIVDTKDDVKEDTQENLSKKKKRKGLGPTATAILSKPVISTINFKINQVKHKIQTKYSYSAALTGNLLM